MKRLAKDTVTPFGQSKPPIYLRRARREPLPARWPARARDGLVSGNRVNLLERYDYPLMNFMNALHLMGFGAKALSGASVSDPAVHTAFCGPGERLANWVIAGRPVRAAHPKAGAEASAVISGWRMDQA
jgi:hypothetical protein